MNKLLLSAAFPFALALSSCKLGYNEELELNEQHEKTESLVGTHGGQLIGHIADAAKECLHEHYDAIAIETASTSQSFSAAAINNDLSSSLGSLNARGGVYRNADGDQRKLKNNWDKLEFGKFTNNTLHETMDSGKLTVKCVIEDSTTDLPSAVIAADGTVDMTIPIPPHITSENLRRITREINPLIRRVNSELHAIQDLGLEGTFDLTFDPKNSSYSMQKIELDPEEFEAGEAGIEELLFDISNFSLDPNS